ncbi:unnamed protein product [Cyprideis torosa]|uniref:Uncharacterized protein n=1 Tax=Cyprideis torosa TaxID=163714 RepID=A0A7R8W6C0_9CRUS|nr:unnamed protein product [Cyprideis torosa]CAG0886245.1 unnamed protein product [Cyprideis torosa]
MIHMDVDTFSTEAGKYRVNCTVTGSNPPAEIHWYINRGEEITLLDFTNRIESDNRTFSTLIWKPLPEDNNRNMVCVGRNPKIRNAELRDQRKLSVTYAPRVHVTSASHELRFRESDAAILHCHVDGNPMPRPRQIEWMHNGTPISSYNVGGSTEIFPNGSLYLRHLTRNAAGSYACSASNSEGFGNSDALNLTVLYAPICASSLKPYYASLGEVIQLTCLVESEPPPKNFTWVFNGSFFLSNEHIVQRGRRSILKYELQGLDSFGSMSCRALNAVGFQQEPCAFEVIRAEIPEPVKNCTPGVSAFDTSISVSCVGGHSIGVPQQFHLSVIGKNNLTRNDSRQKPEFLIPSLPRGVNYTARVFASNLKGTSQVYEFSLDLADDTTATSPSTSSSFPGTLPALGQAQGSGSALGLATFDMPSHPRAARK